MPSKLARRAYAAVAVLTLGALPPAFAATESPNVSRGISAERSFDLGEIDHINNFNGNLLLSIGVGPVYTVSPQLSYQFMLSWNSNVWDGEGDPLLGTTKSFTNRTSNAGLSWQFGLGRILQHNQLGNDQTIPIYLGPDGSRTVFHAAPLPPGEPGQPAQTDGGATYFYSHDSKYLRLRQMGGCAAFPNTGQCIYEIDFPSGVIHRFRQSDGQLEWMKDRFGNQVSFTYDADGDWTVTDGFRTHTIEFDLRQLDTGSSVYMATTASLAGFGGSTATYTFGYSATTNLPRATPYNDPNQSSTAATTLLSSVSGPHGWSISMPAYQTDGSGAAKFAGTLKKFVLPTGGALEWDYIMYNFPADSESRPFLTGSAGVRRRRTRDAAGTLLGEWSYLPAGNTPGARCSGPNPLPSTTVTRSVVSPIGDKTIRYFTSWPCEDLGANGQDRGHYGLPIAMEQTDASGAFLSEEIFDCTANGADPDNPTSCSSERKIYLDYKRDGGAPQEVGEALNQRVSFQKVVYVDDGNKYKSTTWYGFDGYGHYETETLGGNFGAGDSHTTFADYTPQATPWILGLYSTIDETENNVTSRKEFDFNLSTGFLDCVRTLKTGTSRSANDLLVRYTSDTAPSNGSVKQERFYGGDRQSIGTSGACTDGTAAEYTIDHTNQYGARKTSKYAGVSWKFLDLLIDANTGLPSKTTDSAGMVTDLTFDQLNRLTREEPLATGSFGRDAWTLFTYTFAGTGTIGGNAAIGASVSIDRCGPGTNCSGSSRRTTEYVDYDRLGRIYQEGRQLPGDGWNIRRTFYDAAGNKKQVSTWKDSASSSFSFTTFNSIDPFGRPGSVTAPDDKVTTFVRQGDRTVETEQEVALALGGSETKVKRLETYDRQGRLFRVEEYSNPSAATTYVKTDYSYDEESRLVRVCQVPSGSSCGQERLFDYDGRGFLLSEKHPEKGASGNGFVYFKTYDSRGNVWKKRDGVDDTTRELNFEFDEAERLETVKNSAGTTLQSFTYDATSTSNAGLGKLATATRRNELPAPWSNNYQVTESYTYGGRMGRASNRTTSLSVGGVAKESWSYSTGYHELGVADSVTYPTCSGTGCNAVSATPFSVGYSFTRGLLTAIPGWTDDNVTRPIGYHANLLTSSIDHANGMVETIANDPDRIQRPRSITVTALDDAFLPYTAWATGDYAFDGAGNIEAIGADQFQYDKVSRLVHSVLGASVPGRSQSYSFDLYGNLVSKATDGGAPQPIPITTSTNRITGTDNYDAAGNMKFWNANFYSFDLLNTMTALCTSGSIASCSGELWGYVYTADNERVLALKSDGAQENWTIRDFGNRILRREEGVPPGGSQSGTGTSTSCSGTIAVYCQSFESGNYLGWSQIVTGATSQTTDYVWRGDKLFGSQSSGAGAEHYALDHLGTIRLVTSDFGDVTAQHAYFPFGEEATPTDQNAQRMKFTGHERDLQATTANPVDDLDYMHARFNSPLTGRFLGVDVSQGRPAIPQSWNRYSYVLGNPQRFRDPDGLQEESVIESAVHSAIAIACAISICNPTASHSGDGQELPASVMHVGGPMAAARVGGVISKSAQLAEIGRLAGKFVRQFTHLDLGPMGHAQAAGREAAGRIVKLKPDGTPFNHLREFLEAREGVKNSISKLQSMLGSGKLSDAEHAFAKYLMAKYSKALDAAEAAFKKAFDEASKQ